MKDKENTDPLVWISIGARLPIEGQKVIAGHDKGQWVEEDILFAEGGFRKRVNGNTGGVAGYKQKDTKKPNGDPAGPDEWLWGHEVKPTHWMNVPNPPQP